MILGMRDATDAKDWQHRSAIKSINAIMAVNQFAGEIQEPEDNKDVATSPVPFMSGNMCKVVYDSFNLKAKYVDK